MLKKIIVAILLITVVGAAGAAVAYNATQTEPAAAGSLSPLAADANTATSDLTSSDQPAQADLPAPQEAPVAQGMAGEPWQAAGTVTSVDDFGFTLTTTEGETVYVELGQPDFWQNQGIALNSDQVVTVTGSIIDGMIHASAVELVDGSALQVRNESGQPLWSGGAGNSRGQNTGSTNGTHIPEPQAQVDEWITLEGTLVSYQGSSMTMSTAEGELINFKTGQPRFFADQGVTFQVGDAIRVLGFYQGEQFSAGEITQLATGLRVMLRDPNGRPLWAGPGSGNGNGNGGNHGNGGSQG